MIQADAILELQLHRLTKLSIDEINKELGITRDNIAEFESILSSERKLRNVIIKELEEVKKLYGDDRRTQIEDEAAEIQLEDLIADEQVAVTVSHTGYLKRTPISTYRMQRRGGTGRTGMKTREEDFVEHLFIASTHAYILLHQHRPRLLAQGIRNSRRQAPPAKASTWQPGRAAARRNRRTMLPVRDLEEEGKLHLLRHPQRHGEEDRRSKTSRNVMSRGIIAINIEQGRRTHRRPPHRRRSRSSSWRRTTDRPSASTKTTSAPWDATPPASAACVSTTRTTSLAWPPRQTRRRTEGKAKTKDAAKRRRTGAVVDLVKKGSLILSVTENGYGKRTPAEEYRLQGRGGSGVINVKTTERNGKVSASRK